MKRRVLITVGAAVLSGCGGSGGGSPSSEVAASSQAASPEGMYVGTTSTGRAATGLVLNDGSYYVLYSAQNNPNVIAGAVQGTGSASSSSFASSNAKDINLEGLGLMSASLSASFVSVKSLAGTLTYPTLNQTLTFTSTYDKRYEIVPSLSTIAGSYTGTSGSTFGRESASLTVSSAGAVSGIGSSGCKLSGTASPRAKGNVYDVSIVFGGAPCRLANTALSGIAYFDVSTKRLYAVGLTRNRDAGLIYVGTRL